MTDSFLIIALAHLGTGAVMFAAFLPLLFDRIPPNRWYGVRFAKSFSSTANWYAINRQGARYFLPWAALMCIVGGIELMLPTSPPLWLQLLLGHLVLLVLPLPLIQTWRFAQRL